MRFKYEKDKALFHQMKPVLKALISSHVEPTFSRNMPDYEPMVTRTIDEKIPGESVSETHEQGRGTDFRISDIPLEVCKQIVIELNLSLADTFGAISIKDGQKRFAVLESDHIHAQIAPNLPEDIIMKFLAIGLSPKYNKNKGTDA